MAVGIGGVGIIRLGQYITSEIVEWAFREGVLLVMDRLMKIIVEGAAVCMVLLGLLASAGMLMAARALPVARRLLKAAAGCGATVWAFHVLWTIDWAVSGRFVGTWAGLTKPFLFVDATVLVFFVTFLVLGLQQVAPIPERLMRPIWAILGIEFVVSVGMIFSLSGAMETVFAWTGRFALLALDAGMFGAVVIAKNRHRRAAHLTKQRDTESPGSSC
jgi:hypothetical protein